MLLDESVLLDVSVELKKFVVGFSSWESQLEIQVGVSWSCRLVGVWVGNCRLVGVWVEL